jgi:hypothetical protein
MVGKEGVCVRVPHGQLSDTHHACSLCVDLRAAVSSSVSLPDPVSIRVGGRGPGILLVPRGGLYSANWWRVKHLYQNVLQVCCMQRVARCCCETSSRQDHCALTKLCSRRRCCVQVCLLLSQDMRKRGGAVGLFTLLSESEHTRGGV